MEDYLTLAQSYLEAEGWDVRTRGRDLLRGDRDSRHGDDEKDYVYVWVPANVGVSFSRREGPYLRRFEEARVEHPTAEKFLLLPTLEGLSTEFRRGARRWYGVKILVPAQFFDSNFRWERDERAASATSALRERGADVARKRIAQPFRVIQSLGSDDDGPRPDLLDVLRAELRNPLSKKDRPTIHVVVGPAGMGKSVLFSSLYAHLYEDFQANKRAHELSARPFALLPEHLDDATAPTIGSLLDAYLRTELARPMGRDMFNWKLIHGLGVWLLDGLDEILERDEKFFDYLEDLMTMPSGETLPSIVICVRDSLLETHRGLKAFCEGDCSSYVIVYQLEGWQQESKADFARMHLSSGTDVTKFVESLAERPALDDLASTPYYCELLIEEFVADGLQPDTFETDILERALARIVDREREKGLLSGIPNKEINEFMESCATIDLFEGGVSTEVVREFAEVVIPESIEEEESRLATQMGQIAVFSYGYDGRLRFAQEPLKHYLAAKYLAQNLQSKSLSNDLGRDLGLYELPENVIRLMYKCIDSDVYDEVWRLLASKAREATITGRNALRLAIQMSGDMGRISDIRFVGLDLSGMQFRRLILRGVQFDGADLTNTEFRSTDLTDSSFENCLIKGTRFDAKREMLRSLRFGDMRRFHSAHIGNRFVDDYVVFHEIVGSTGGPGNGTQPACATARQLRHLFGKFVEETGRGRRKDIHTRALQRGKRIVEHRDDILREAIRAGYLVETPHRDRISRAQDESYGEIVRFRTELQVSPGIRALLDDTCSEAGCSHVS